MIVDDNIIVRFVTPDLLERHAQAPHDLLPAVERPPGQARLRQLSDAADPRTRTYEAKYVLSGQAAQAPLGSTMGVALSDQGVDRGAGGVEAPIGAIHDAGKGPGVWVVEPRASTVQWRPVRLAAIGAETATISSGLAGGERFVALGAHMLHQGQRVRIQTGAAH